MRYRDTRTGATYEPSSGFVASQMAGNPALVPVADRPDTDLSALTVAQLRAKCRELGVTVPSRATKAQIIDLLTG